jgi:hypothetical protein
VRQHGRKVLLGGKGMRNVKPEWNGIKRNIIAEGVHGGALAERKPLINGRLVSSATNFCAITRYKVPALLNYSTVELTHWLHDSGQSTWCVVNCSAIPFFVSNMNAVSDVLRHLSIKSSALYELKKRE